MIPCSCAAASASTICFAIGNASSIGIGPRAIRCERSSPSTSSITRARDTARFLEAVDAADVRVIQGCEDLRFPLESREAIGIGRERLRQNLYRDVALQLRVAGPIHFAHAARRRVSRRLRRDPRDHQPRELGEACMWSVAVGGGRSRTLPSAASHVNSDSTSRRSASSSPVAAARKASRSPAGRAAAD